MRLLFTFIITLFLTLQLSAGEVRIVLGTTAPITAFTKAVLKHVPGYRVEQLLPAAIGCPHDYSLTPQEVRRISKANIIVKNGLGMDDFVDSVLKKLHSKAFVVDSSRGVKGVIEEEHGHHHHHAGEKHEHHGHHESFNEHLFAAPSTAAGVVRSIADSFSKLDPANASYFRRNSANYIRELEKIAGAYAAFAKKVPEGKKNIAIQHSIFAYFARECGLKSEVCLQEHSGQEPSPTQIRHLIKEIKEEKVFVILAEKCAPEKVAELIGRESGVRVLFMDVNPVKADPAEILVIFRRNLEVFKSFSGVK